MLNIVFLRFSCTVDCISFFFLSLSCVSLCKYTTIYYYPVEGHLSSFQFFVIKNKTAVNVSVRDFLFYFTVEINNIQNLNSCAWLPRHVFLSAAYLSISFCISSQPAHFLFGCLEFDDHYGISEHFVLLLWIYLWYFRVYFSPCMPILNLTHFSKYS